MTLLIFYLLLALVVSFYCSIAEAVLLSVTPSYIESQMAQGKAWSKTLLRFKTDIDRPLSAILSLNTIAHTVGAAGVGAQASIVFSNISVGIISGVLTLLILVFSELIPKTIGASYWKGLALFTTKTLKWLIYLMYPLVLLSRLITGVFKKKKQNKVERSEVIALAEIGQREGVFTREEARILRNLIGFRTIRVKDVMTPRTVVVAAREEMTAKEFSTDKRFNQYSRIPLFKGSKDNITGFVHKHDVMQHVVSGEPDVKLKELMRDIALVDENESLYKLYTFFTQRREQVAIVSEEFGGTAGIVTMEDVLETLLGLEIVDEFDELDDLQDYARKQWEKRAEKRGIDTSFNNLPDEEKTA
ncbi:hemolysin family protein [Halocola ammonii]